MIYWPDILGVSSEFGHSCQITPAFALLKVCFFVFLGFFLATPSTGFLLVKT